MFQIHKVPTPVDDSIPAAAAVPYGTRQETSFVNLN